MGRHAPLTLLSVAVFLALAHPGTALAAPGAPPTREATPAGPRPGYECRFNVATDAFTGADGTASAIGWMSDHNSVITCLGGTFVVQDGPGALFRQVGFGVYDGQRATWTDADGYLPAQITSFDDQGADVSITELADEVTVDGERFVAVYSRVRVDNVTDHSVEVDPGASPSLVPLDAISATVAPHHAANHDYVILSDRFGADVPWPSDRSLVAAGGFDQHFAHMRAFWDAQLATIARVDVPDRQLVDAYESGFITTQLTRSGNDLDTGVNGYQSEFSHDVIGILTNLFTQGYFTDAHELLTEARDVVGTPGQYVDGLWTYSVPWAVYLMKTGDAAFVRQNFATEGPAGPTQPSIEQAAHLIAADRTGPDGTMEATHDIDTPGYWTQDDEEALLGLAAYRDVAARIGETGQASWAASEEASLLSATDAVLSRTIAANHLTYLPCSLVEPNSADRCANPEDANWTSPLGTWAWQGSLLGATVRGPMLDLIDATYDQGFARLHGLLPPGTTGGFPDDWYSSAYDAAMGSAGLASAHHRDQGIANFEFMLEHTQSGPFSWWESASAPDPRSPWVGDHPASGQGSSPHAWGMAGADKVLLDSLVAERFDGGLVIGRGVPWSWLHRGGVVTVAGFPTTEGHRIDVALSAHGDTVSFARRGAPPAGPVVLSLPAFVDDVASTSAGRVDQAAGTVTIAPDVGQVTVTLRRPPPG